MSCRRAVHTCSPDPPVPEGTCEWAPRSTVPKDRPPRRRALQAARRGHGQAAPRGTATALQEPWRRPKTTFSIHRVIASQLLPRSAPKSIAKVLPRSSAVDGSARASAASGLRETLSQRHCRADAPLSSAPTALLPVRSEELPGRGAVPLGPGHPLFSHAPPHLAADRPVRMGTWRP
jgi:hypothetical protein